MVAKNIVNTACLSDQTHLLLSISCCRDMQQIHLTIIHEKISSIPFKAFALVRRMISSAFEVS